MMHIRGVVFDVDDTLYDMAEPFFGAYRAIYGMEYDLPMQALFLRFRRYSDEKFDDAQVGKMTMDEMYIYRLRMAMQDYDIEITDDQALAFQQQYQSRQYQICMSPTMHRILQELCAHVPIGIITNGSSLHQRGKLRSLDVSPWVDDEHIIISGDHPFRKPDVRIFQEMEHRLHLLPEQLLYVGDAFDLDIRGASAAGWHSIWFNHRKRSVPQTTVIAPDAEVHTEKELANLLIKAVKSA